MKKSEIGLLSALIMSTLLLMISWSVIWHFMCYDGVVLRTALVFGAVTPPASFVFWICCMCTKNIRLILVSVLPGVFSLLACIYLICHVARIG
jgi:hypothetical protein